MKAHVDQDECVGCETCVSICDSVFKMDDDGKAEAYGEVTPDNHSEVQEAIDSCPASCISWEK